MAFVWSAETCTPEAEFSEVGECLFPFFAGFFFSSIPSQSGWPRAVLTNLLQLAIRTVVACDEISQMDRCGAISHPIIGRRRVASAANFGGPKVPVEANSRPRRQTEGAYRCGFEIVCQQGLRRDDNSRNRGLCGVCGGPDPPVFQRQGGPATGPNGVPSLARGS